MLNQYLGCRCEGDIGLTTDAKLGMYSAIGNVSYNGPILGIVNRYFEAIFAIFIR